MKWIGITTFWGSFVVFGVACLAFVVFPPAGFVIWLISVPMFFVGAGAWIGGRKADKARRRPGE